MFLANGSIDDELLRILQGSGITNLRWFDLTARDALEKLRAEIAAIDGHPSTNGGADAQPGRIPVDSGPVSPRAVANDAIDAESAKLKAMNVELERKLHELDARRHKETEELKERLARLAIDVKSERHDAVRREAKISPERARASYEAMLEEPSFNKKLRYFGRPLFIGIVCVGFGLFLITARDHLVYWLLRSENPAAQVVMLFMGFAFSIVGVWTIWRRYSRVADYFEFSRQMIRDLYVRDVPIKELARINIVLRRTIDRYGPYREAVLKQLLSKDLSEDLSPTVRHYVKEIAH
jgi:hypothetical protein